MIEQEIPTTMIRSTVGNNIATTQQRHAVKILAIFEMILCILVAFAGIAEVVIATGQCVHYYEHYGSGYRLYSSCFYDQTFGQALWCSLFPFIASIIGIVTAKSPTMEKVRLLMGFSIVGVMFLIALICLELYHLSFYFYQSPTWYYRLNIYNSNDYNLYVGYFGLQWGIFGGGAINLILMFTSACYSCCMGNQNNEVGQGNIVVSYGGQGGGQPVYSLSSGIQGKSHQQRHQVIMMNPSQQHVSSEQYTNPVFYTQPQMQQREPTQFIMVQREPTQPQIIQREMAQPQIIQREMTQPQIIQREMAQPQIIQQEMTQPQIIQREMTQPQLERREEIESQLIRDEEPQFSATEQEINLPQQIE